MTKKILIYTDSRGQHTPRGAPVHEVFAERLANHPDIDAEIVLCPMKWTTTLDFFEYIKDRDPSQWDHIILFTGIVEWSPRPQPSAINDLYNNTSPANLTNTGLNTRDYSRKVVNNKKPAFDALFGEAEITAYLSNDLGVEYEGQPTVNMYGLDMARDHLIPRLKEIPNLIFINSNRFIPGWEGDFARGRPANIRVTEAYSELFRDELGPETVIDLLTWNEQEIKRYTCDNLHLTREGSDWIYDEIVARLAASEVEKPGAAPIAPFGRAIVPPIRMDAAMRAAARAKAGLKEGSKLATLIIGIRLNDDDGVRTRNLIFLLDWIHHFYGDLFDVLLLEQDSVSRIDKIKSHIRPYHRHEFVFNDQAYNRGWGYNVAVRHFTTNEVVALMDTDVLTGENFVDEIIKCRHDYKFISPYTNVYFTEPNESVAVRSSRSFSKLTDISRVTKPTTITGGVVIARRSAYEDLAGFEQYTGYGGEDRALDVTLLNQCDKDDWRMAPFTYVHLHHPPGKIDHSNLAEILKHLNENYGCTVDRTIPADGYIHKNCPHVDKSATQKNIQLRQPSYGRIDLYESGKPISINGCIGQESPTSAVAIKPAMIPHTADVVDKRMIFPPEFQDVNIYTAKEHYNAPEPDRDRLAKFYNSCKGQRCFIIGNGPSLNRHDLSLLKNEHTFGVNSFFYKTKETGFTPTYFVVEDNAVMKDNIEQIRKYDAPYKFFPTIYKSLHPEADNVYFFEMNRGFYEKSSPNYCVPRFSTDATKVLYCGQSVTYINLQIAFFMGFTEVYLIGMDFDYVIPESHERRGDLIISTTDDPNHFHKDYFGAGKIWKDPKLDRVAMNYRQAKLAYEAVGRKIYNATIGGKLEIFDRVDYEALLRDPVTGHKRQERVPPVIIRRAGEQSRQMEITKPDTATGSEVPTGNTHSADQKVRRAWYAPIGNAVRTYAPALFPVLQRGRRIIWKLLGSPSVWLATAGGIAAIGLTLEGPWPMEQRLTLAGAVAGAAGLAALGLIAWRFRRYIANLSAQNHALFSEIERIHELTKGRDARAEQLSGHQERLRGEIARLRNESRKAAEAARMSMTDELARLQEHLTRQTAEQTSRQDQKIRKDLEAAIAELNAGIANLDAQQKALAAEAEQSVEVQLDELHQRMNATLEEQWRWQEQAAEGNQKAEARLEELNQRLESQKEETNGKVQEAMEELNQRLEFQKEETNGKVQEAMEELNQRLEFQKEETNGKVQEAMEELNQRLAGMEDKAEFGARALDAAKQELEDSMKALRQGLEQRMFAEIDEYTKGMTSELITRIDAIEAARAQGDEAYKAGLDALKKALDEELKPEVGEVREVAESAHSLAKETKKAVQAAKAESVRLRERAEASERQIGALRYPDAPDVFVFFGHHKCASRFFRLEVFGRIAESTGARTRRYEIKDPPFHYSRMDELDLVNVDFKGLGKDGRDVVWFANASQRGLNKIKRNAEDWKGLRIIRDPRQVLISNYFHHKGDHPDESPLGWIWDQLVKDKPILRELPEEDGILHELDNISKQVIEDQILAPFDDERVMTIRLEDFSKDPGGHLLKISEFLKVPDVAGINFGNTQANPDSGPWHKHFTSRIREAFKERYGQALIDLGYAEDMDW